MATFDADYIQRLDQQAESAQHEFEQMKSAQRELDKVDRLGLQTISVSDMVAPSLTSMMGTSMLDMMAPSLASTMQQVAEKAARPLISTTLQDFAKSMATAHASSYQNLAGVGLAQHQRVMQQGIADVAEPLMSRFRDVTQLAAATQLGSFQNLAPQFATAQLGNMNGLSASMLEAQLRPMNKMAELLLQAKLQPMRSLALGLAQPYALRDSPFMSVFNNLDTTFEQFNRLASSSASNMRQGFQAQQGSLLANQVAKAVSEAARTSPAWGQLSATLRDYQLRDVWFAPQPRETTQPPQPGPATDAEASLMPEPVTEAPAAPEEDLQLFDSGWRMLSISFRNVLDSIRHPHPVVRVLAIGIGQVLIQVIAGGIVYFLFYSN